MVNDIHALGQENTEQGRQNTKYDQQSLGMSWEHKPEYKYQSRRDYCSHYFLPCAPAQLLGQNKYNNPVQIDYEGPRIYKQFTNNYSINPEIGSISFVIEDLSNISNVSFDLPLEGNWIIENDLYHFIFNDSSIPEGLLSCQLMCKDSLNYSTSIEFSLLIDKTSPNFIELINHYEYLMVFIL